MFFTPHATPPIPRDTHRRRCLRAGAALLASAATALAIAPLAGCGFELRRATTLPFRTVLLSGFKANSLFEKELREQINISENTRVVDNAADAEVVLEALADQRDRNAIASTSAGQVRELNLRLQFNFRVRNLAGRELIGPTALVLTRGMSYSETAAQSKEQEEALIFRALQTDIVTQVVRRLARTAMAAPAAASSASAGSVPLPSPSPATAPGAAPAAAPPLIPPTVPAVPTAPPR
jgi:LPS-assembly lipoprotein